MCFLLHVSLASGDAASVLQQRFTFYAGLAGDSTLGKDSQGGAGEHGALQGERKGREASLPRYRCVFR